jgi:cytochrome c oxidase subunit 4
MAEQDFYSHPSTHHVVPVRYYIIVFATLLFCTGLTVYAAELDLGSLNVPIALAIATFKALLVLLIFMHVKYSSRLVGAIIISTAAWLIVLLYGVAGDFIVRPKLIGVQYATPPAEQIAGPSVPGEKAMPVEDPQPNAN